MEYVTDRVALLFPGACTVIGSVMEDTPEGLLVTLKVRMESEVLQWLLSWGGNVRVLEPDSLRRRLAEEGKKIVENYRKS